MASFRMTAVAALSVLIVAPVSAQPGAGGLASVTASALTIEHDTTASIAASIGYRLNPIAAIGIELTFVPSFRPQLPDFPTILNQGVSLAGGVSPLIFPPPEFNIEAREGRATIFTGNLRLTIPTGSPRLSPYLVGGAGVGNVRDELGYTIRYPPILRPAVVTGIVVFPPITETIRRTTTDFAMTFGGGVSVLVSDGWSIDGDVRYLGVTGGRDIHSGRYGAGITFRF
jgi:hypothetical protein